MIYSLEIAGHHKGSIAYDVRKPSGAFAALIVANANGTFTHYYDSNAHKGSTKRFKSWGELFANIDRRHAAIAAKRAAA